jgi:3-methylfumaryl-CoA hydratase
VLFRFSALTYNAHRIHYDRDYAAAEGYRDLVVHGPLQALLMSELIRRNGLPMLGRQFSYRLVAPVFGSQRLTVTATLNGADASAEVYDASGQVSAVGTLQAVGT